MNVIVVNGNKFNKDWLKSVDFNRAYAILKNTRSKDDVLKAWNIANGIKMPTKKTRKKKEN